jgi:hypothetical protein
MAIGRTEYEIKQLAFGIADRAIRSPYEIDVRTAESALQVFIRTPGLLHEHDAAMKAIHALDALGAVSEQRAEEMSQLRRAAWEAFDKLDSLYDHNRGYEHYQELGPTFIPFEEQNRV